MNKDLLQWHIAAESARAALALMHERLEVNDCHGDEQEFMDVCIKAIEELDALPINFEAVREARKPKGRAA